MFDQIVSNLCAYLIFKTPGCNETLRAWGTQTHVEQQTDEVEHQLVTQYTREAYSVLGKKTVELTFATGFIANTISTGSLQFQTSLKPFADEVKFNGSRNDPNSPANWNVNLNWKW